MYFFLTHLSIADMITGFFNVLSQAAWVWTITFRGDNVLCKFVKYTQMLGPYLSSYVLVMTSIDRYQAICHPLSHSSSTHSRSRYMILTAWLISLFFCLPQSIIFSYQKVDHPPYVDCWVTFAVSCFCLHLPILLQSIWLKQKFSTSLKKQITLAKRVVGA